MARPKIGKRIEKATFDYFRGHKGSAGAFKSGLEGLGVRLQKLGWTLLGKGYFSSVYQNPKKNYVLKINSRPDEGYAEYVRIIKKTKNKHFPRISDMKVLSLPTKSIWGEKRYIIIMFISLKNCTK